MENYKIGNRTLIGSVVLVAIFFFLCSCGTRKVEKSETKETEQTEVKITSETITRANDNTKIVDTSTIEEFEIVPIDNSKPIFINNVEIKNAKIRSKKTKSDIVTIKNIIVAKNEQNKSNLSKSNIKVFEVKQIDKKQFNFLSLWCILLLISAGYLIYRKYKGLSPF